MRLVVAGTGLDCEQRGHGGGQCSKRLNVGKVLLAIGGQVGKRCASTSVKVRERGDAFMRSIGFSDGGAIATLKSQITPTIEKATSMSVWMMIPIPARVDTVLGYMSRRENLE